MGPPLVRYMLTVSYHARALYMLHGVKASAANRNCCTISVLKYHILTRQLHNGINMFEAV